MKVIVKSFFIFVYILFLAFSLNSSILLKMTEPQRMPEYRYFKENSEFIKSIKNKNITVAEYILDPLIMYTSLWGCMALSLPLWESPSFSLITNSNEFTERMKMEPFVSGRIDNVTKSMKDLNGNIMYDSFGNVLQTLKNDFYAKNFLEPAYFTYLAMYMRSKNYHPAIMISELFVLSFIYEFTIRPFFMNSNFEQLIKNPCSGIVFGILLDELSNFLLSTPYTGLHVLAYILNPFNALPVARIKPLLFMEPYKKTISIEAIIKM